MAFTPTAGKHNYKRGASDPRILEVKAATAVKIGDLVARDSAVSRRYIIPASSWAWTTDLATTRAAFVVEFCGVSAQYIDETKTNRKCRVPTRGIFEFKLPSGAAALNPGDLVGPGDSGANSLLNDTVAVVTNVLQAIGRVYNYTPANSATVLVDIRGRVFHGPQA